VRHNRISHNKREGAVIRDGGKGVFDHNDLTRNKRGAWYIGKDCIAGVTRENNKE
jgi:hypothetical protein